MSETALPGGTLTLAPDFTVTRMGYGAMQLMWADPTAASPVLRAAADMGMTHIDSSDYYGPHKVNEYIRETLHPYPETLHIATKVGFVGGDPRSWRAAHAPDELRTAVHGNLERLGVDSLDLVNLRMGGMNSPLPGSIEEPFSALAELQQQGLIKHLGVSTVSAEQVAEARSIAPIVAVQNFYNLKNRADDDLIDRLAKEGIAYVPYAPLGGGFDPLKATYLDTVAARHDSTPLGIALAWLLQRSPNILLIPGTTSIAHLQENIAGAAITLTAEDLVELDKINGAG